MLGELINDEKKILIKTFNYYIDKYAFDQTLRKPKHQWIKDPVLSKAARSEGNELYKKVNHNSEVHEIIHHKYTLSISLAPASSEELALAYGNRSAVLFHLSKFDDCVQDIDRALSITKSNILKTKLLCRKAKCLAAVGSSSVVEIEKIFRKARFFCNNCDQLEKESLIKLIEKAKNYTKANNKIEEIKNLTISEPMNVLQGKSLNDFSSVKISHNEKYGNHLIATKDIEPGEVIFVEKPQVFTVDIEKILTYCDHCFKACWSTLPCDSCSRCMYCSEECKKKAWMKYHDIECSAVFKSKISMSDNTSEQVLLMTIRAVISAVKEAGSIRKLKKSLEKFDKNPGNKSVFYWLTRSKISIIRENNKF